MTDSVEENLREALKYAENEETKYYIRDALQQILIDGPDHEHSDPTDNS